MTSVPVRLCTVNIIEASQQVIIIERYNVDVLVN